jgi:DUF1365 family protein
VTASALYTGKVVHQRHRPVRHRLEYRVFSLMVDLDEPDRLDKRLRLFGHNRFSLFSLMDRDFGDGRGGDLRDYVRRRLAQAGIEDATRSVRLLCYPRVLGYVFNPLSVYYCYRADESLGAVIYEVNNTHGERHSYVVPVENVRQGGTIRQGCDKRFFVSPFLPMDCHYRFHLQPPGERLSLFIRQTHQGEPILDAWVVGRRSELTDASLLRTALSIPLLTMKVIAAIHWEALKLWLKGLPVFNHEPGPAHGVSLIERKHQT